MPTLHEIITLLMSYNTANFDSSPSEQILESLEAVRKLLKDSGVSCRVQKYACRLKGSNKVVSRANLFAVPKRTLGPYLLFQGHIDTVPFPGKYRFRLTNNILSGRGSVDMKGPLAGSLDAFLRLCQTKNWSIPPALLITGDEEANGFAGIKTFLQKPHPKILFCVNGEPTNMAISSHLYGVIGYKIVRTGRPGHSAFSKKAQLIENSLPLLNAVQKFLTAARKISERRFGTTHGALTIVRAGEKSNQLPRELLVSWNIRTVKLRSVYDKLFQKIVAPALRTSDTKKIFAFNPCTVHLAPAISQSLRASMKSIGRNFTDIPIACFTEATLLNMAHIPAIVCGPGNGHLAHVTPADEKIALQDIRAYSDFLRTFVSCYNQQWGFNQNFYHEPF